MNSLKSMKYAHDSLLFCLISMVLADINKGSGLLSITSDDAIAKLLHYICCPRDFSLVSLKKLFCELIPNKTERHS